MRHKKLIMVLSAVLVLSGCYGAFHLRTSYLGDTMNIKGTFDVIYYGARFSDDPDSLVVLDVAGDGYKIEPLSLKQSYHIEKGLPVEEALRKGIAFLKQNKYYDDVVYHAIHAQDGTVIGYEMMPEYEPFTYIARRPISVNYYMKGKNTVKFLVQEHYSFDRDFRIPRK